jgi:uncharacterized membrane protein
MIGDLFTNWKFNVACAIPVAALMVLDVYWGYYAVAIVNAGCVVTLLVCAVMNHGHDH